MQNNTEDIQALFPNTEVKVGGEVVVVRPFYFGELPVVIRHILPILSASGLSSMLRVIKKDDGTFSVQMDVPENFLDLMTGALLDVSEPVMDLLAFALGKERAWFNTVTMEEGAVLTLKWFEVNRDFFVQRVLPRLAPLMKKTPLTGSESSASSSEPVTSAAT